MGAGVAQVTVDKGYDVILKDTNDAGLYRGVGQIQTNFETAVKRKRFSGYKNRHFFLLIHFCFPNCS